MISLLFNRLSRFVIAFLPRSKHLLLSWLQSLSAVLLEPKKIKSVTVSILSSSICHEVIGPGVMIFIFLNVKFQSRLFTLKKFLKPYSCMSGECILGSVSSQQRFGVMDIIALSASQLSGLGQTVL